MLEGKGRMKKIGPKSIAAYFGDQIGDFPKEDQRYRSLTISLFFQTLCMGNGKLTTSS